MTAPSDSTTGARAAALVTGASGGIGQALARALAERGYDVVLSARNVERLEQLAAELRRLGAGVHVLPCDARDPDAVRELVRAAIDRCGALHVVVANAGVYRRKLATDVDRQDFDDMFAANFFSAFELVAAALPHLRERRAGHIVLMNSFDAKKGLMMDCPYVAAKSALAGYAATLRQALRGSGVHVCSVFPGRVDTPMIADLQVPAISAKIPPERVARAVVRAIARRKAEVIVPWHVRLLHWADVLSPRLGDWFARRLGLDGRHAP